MPLHTNSRTFTVANGGTTGFVDLEDFDELGLIVPALTSTTLKLQVSQDNVTYYDVYDGTGVQVLSWSASTGTRAFSTVDLAHVVGYSYLAVVCGTSQGADRTFTLTWTDPRRKGS